MKFCKNCGHESEDGKIRCSYCGYLFDDEMDNVIREINTNLNNYKNDLTAKQPTPNEQSVVAQNVQVGATANAQGVSAQEGASVPVVTATANENEDLKLEIANLKGQITAMQGELNRMSQRSGNSTPNQVIYHTSPSQPNTYAYPAPAQFGVYSQAPAPAEQSDSKPKKAKKAKKERKKSRIVLSVIALLLLAVSITFFFFAWINDGFTGFDGIKYVFGFGGENFGAYCETLWAYPFPGSAFIPTVCKYVCTFIVKYGVTVYAALLILSLPILFSLGGRVRFKAWHAFFAWTSAIVALLIFGVIFWVSGFSVMTYFFLCGAAANILRGFFLLFYK